MAKPSCLRCIKASRNCEGYENPSTDDICGELSSLRFNSSQDVERVRLSSLGCVSLHLGSLSQQSAAATFWRKTLPQMGQTHPLVGVSMTALGAAMELRQRRVQESILAAACRYEDALRRIRENLLSKERHSIPLVVACMLLAMADVLIGQEESALSHLEGTLALLRQRQQRIPRISSGTTTENKDDDGAHFTICDEFDLAGAVLDVATS